MISFSVLGIAQSAGSKHALPFKRKDGRLGVAVSDDNPRLKDWKAVVAWSAREAVGSGFVPLRCALEVEFTFYRVRPRGHFRKDGTLSKVGVAMSYPITRPDATKLMRAAEDSLTGIIWRDDSQLVTQRALKRWGEVPSVEIRVMEL